MLIKKDLRVELRAKDAIFTAVFFSIVVVLVFTFAMLDTKTAGRLAAGVVWVATTFAATFLFARTFAREVEAGTLDTLLTSEVPRPLVFLAKWIVNLVFALAVAVLLSVLAAFLFMAPIERDVGLWTLTLFLGLVGFTAVGTLLAAMVASARIRDAMLPIALYPVAIPSLLASVKASQALVDGATEEIAQWFAVLAVFDIVFGAAAIWLFGMVVED